MTGLLPNLNRVIGLSGGALDTLMPMHVWVDLDGRIVQAGPTLTKMAGQGELTGKPVFSLLELRRPVPVRGVQALMRLEGRRLGLVLKQAPDLPLRGTLTGLPEGAGVIMDISLGLSFARGVTQFDLTLSDFSPCDQTLELLYLNEANRSTMRLSRHLSQRLEAARAAAETQAMTDALTGLANRRAMDLDLLRSLRDPTQDFGLLHVDLDLFKQVNDTHGHAAGDAVLERVGRVLRSVTRHDDMAGRVGGDEFLILVRDCTDADHLGAIAARLIREIEVPIPFENHSCRISASIGITATGTYAVRPGLDELLVDADTALYQAKRGGRGRFVFHGMAGSEIPAGRRVGDPAPRGRLARRGEHGTASEDPGEETAH